MSTTPTATQVATNPATVPVAVKPIVAAATSTASTPAKPADKPRMTLEDAKAQAKAKYVVKDEDYATLMEKIKELSPEAFLEIRERVSNIPVRDSTSCNERIQFMVTKDEKKAINNIAKKHGHSVSSLLRSYLKSMHPESAALLSNLRLTLNTQLRQLADIQDKNTGDSLSLESLLNAVKRLEQTTAVINKLLNERA